MAKLSQIPTLKVEDFPALMEASKGEAEKLFRSLNSAISAFQSALNGNLMLTENARAFLKTLTVAAPVSVSFKNALGMKPAAVLVASAQEMTSGTAVPVSLGGVSWTTSGDQVVVSDVANTTASHLYRVTFLVLGG